VNWRLVVQKTRVKKKCVQFSSEGGERRCSPYGWRQTVRCLWSGNREWSVVQGWSPDRRDIQSCCGWRAQVTAALDVSYPADTVSDIGRSCAVEIAECRNTEAEPYPLWDAQPVEIAQERRDAFRTPRWEHKSCGGVEDRLKSVQKVTRNADQHWAAVVELADN